MLMHFNHFNLMFKNCIPQSEIQQNTLFQVTGWALDPDSTSAGDKDATALVEAVTLAKDVGFSPRKSFQIRPVAESQQFSSFGNNSKNPMRNERKNVEM